MGGFSRSAIVVGSQLAARLQGLAQPSALRLDRCFGGPDEALGYLTQSRVDLVFISDEISRAACLDLLSHFHHRRHQLPPAVVLGLEPDIAHAAAYIRAGASDYLPAPRDLDALAVILARSVPENLARELHTAPHCPPGVGIVGESAGLSRAMELIARVGKSHCNPVLLCGETGTGKELAARAVHTWRHGGMAKFVAVNCAALTATLLESELFGHVKGAFTGADRDKTGLFELAQGGSLFLDEISEMSLDLQAKLLRVLQERTFRKVGGTADLSSNATIIASSNRRLLDEVAAGKFRCDLYYRLAVFPITLPPLRDPSRRQDIALLAKHFVAVESAHGHRAREISPAALTRLAQHPWPGNVRELRNVIERALLLESSDTISPENILFDDQEFASLTAPAPAAAPGQAACEDFSLEAAEREFIVRALKEANWQRTRAASLLGITRATLHAKLKRYDIKAPGGRSAEPAENPADESADAPASNSDESACTA